MERARAHILVSGLVQGVFFRAHTTEEAKRLGLTGWVRNLPDGRVEAVFEGEKEKIQEMIRWAKKGPKFATVDKVDIEWQEYQGEYNNFKIKYE